MREGDAFTHDVYYGRIDAVVCDTVFIMKDEHFNGYEVVHRGGVVVSVRAYPSTPERNADTGVIEPAARIQSGNTSG